MPRLPLIALTLLAALPLVACIEERLTVELLTQVRGDGSCTRRVEYRLERVDSDEGNARVAIPPEQDLLRRRFRFPSGEPWQTSDQAELGLHMVAVEGQLPSPQAADGDYFFAGSPKAQPARNLVSAFVDFEHGVYEYQEVLRDPSSPLAAARVLSRAGFKAEQSFADAFVEAFSEALAKSVEGKTAVPRTTDLRRLYRELVAEPFAHQVAALAERPLYGPRERGELDQLYEQLGERFEQLAARISTLVTGVPRDAVDAALEAALKKIGEGLKAQLDELGLPSPTEAQPQIHFRATLVMPVPILRANTCFAGDTAVWEFDAEDLFGRGFEMKALASSR